MKNLLLVTLTGVAWVGSAGLALGAGGQGTTAADVLKVNYGPRPVAMGGAFFGLSDDVNAMVYNPAGLLQLRKAELQYQHFANFAEINYEFLDYAMPLDRKSDIGTHLVFRHMSQIDNRNGNPPVSAWDLMWFGSYARKMGVIADGVLSLGGNLKVVNSHIGTNSGTLVGIDVAAMYFVSQDVVRGLRFGATIQNLATPMKFINVADPPPIRGGLGASWRAYKDDYNDISIVSDFSALYETTPHFNIGFEYWLINMVALRGGYSFERPGNAFNSLALGIGVKYTDLPPLDYQLDFALKPADWGSGTLDSTYFVALKVAFETSSH